MNGYSKSGKTTLVNKIKEKFPGQFVSVDSIEIHNFLNTTYEVFKDDSTIYGDSYQLREKATKAIQRELQKVLLENRANLIDDSCNSTIEKRKKLIETAGEIDPYINVLIIVVEISEEDLLERLNKLDDEQESRGEKCTWVDLYKEIQKPSYQIPTSEEADVVYYDGTNENEVFEKILFMFS